MKTKIHNKSIGIDLNQSFNENNQHREYLPELKTSWIETLKSLSLSVAICLIIFPIGFILVGIIYRHSCVAKT